MGQRNVIRKLVSATTRSRTAATVYDGEWDFLYQTAPVGLAIYDRELRYVRVNESLARMNGVPANSHPGATVREIIPDLAPALEPLLREVIDTGKPILDREMRGTTPSSEEERWWLTSFHPLKKGTQVYGVSCAVQEITEVRTAQQMLALTQHSVDHASDEILWLDATGRFVYVNQAACRRLEYTLGEMVQMNVRDIVPNSPPERYSQVWAQLHESSSMTFESRHRSKSGRVFPVEIAINLVEFQGREYCFAVVRDIAERKDTETRAQEAQKKARLLQSKLVEIATDQSLWNGGITETIKRINEIVAKALETQRASVWLLDRESKAMRALDVFDRRDSSHTSGRAIPLENSPQFFKAASQGRVIAVTNVFKDPFTAALAEDYLKPLDIISVVNAPVRVAGKVPALLCVGHTGFGREWTPEEVNFLAEVADQVGHAMLNAERQQTERMIQRLAKDVANKTGHEFFRSVVSSLAEVLEADIALVAEVLPPGQQRIRSLARWVDGKEGANFEKDLAGTPTANVISGGACSYPSNLQEQFPQDTALAQAGAQAFFGTPLISSAGKSLGLLSVLYRRPVSNVPLVEAGLAAFAARAAAEMERLQNEESLRRSEDRYRAFVANAQESIWRVEFEPPVPTSLPEEEMLERMMDDGYLAEISDFGARMRGYREGASELVGMSLRDVVRNESRNTDTIRMTLRNNFQLEAGVFSIRTRDGGTKHIYRTGFGVVENGLLRRVWGTGLDVTDLMNSQAEVRQLNATLETQVAQRTAELRATVEELEAFSHSISHDLRAPLLGIAGCSRALLEDYAEKLEPGAMDWIKLIQRDSEHLDRLLNSLLGLSRITRAELFRQPVDLTTMAESVISALQQSEPERKVTPAIAEGMTAVGDQTLLRVALENLIGNAWKFSQTRAASRIEVGVASVNGAPAYYVRDNGVGFDPRYASRLFAAFERLHGGDFEGTGIGLATVRRIIHRHGGRAWAEGAVGQGATFYFTLGSAEGAGV